MGVLGVEVQKLVEENVGSWGEAHRSSGMAGICLGGGINLEELISVRSPGRGKRWRNSASNGYR
jgi:hypothetical protein